MSERESHTPTHTHNKQTHTFPSICVAPAKWAGDADEGEEAEEEGSPMTAEEFCSQDNVIGFADYLVYVHRTPQGGHLAASTAEVYLRNVMQMAKRHYKDYKGDFFCCLDQDAGDKHKWYKKVCDSVKSACSIRAINAGMPITESAPLVARDTIAKVAEVYYAANTLEGCYR